MNNPFQRFDWNLRSCGWHGHVTYRPDERDLAERLVVATAAGEAWRCLRCGDFVPGAPDDGGPAASAPIVLRGRALRDAFVLRLLAVERFLRGLLLLALAYGIYRFNGAQDSLQRVFDRYLPVFRTAADKVGIDLQNTGPVRLIEHALQLRHSTLLLVAAGVLAYAALQLGEGTGLWLMRRWGEYLAVVGTGAFVPLEVYEIVEKVTWLRIAALLVNIFAVVYILYTKRLFGLRGGHAAFEAERHSESLLEIESAAMGAAPPEPLEAAGR